MIHNDQAGAGAAPAPPVPVEPSNASPAVPLAVTAGSASEPAAPEQTPVVIRAWRRMRHEPSLLFTVAYLFVSCIGLWANYWFYDGFGLPILEYMQASDYLVAGLRDPAYALVLLITFVLIALVSAPDLYRRHHPARVEVWRGKWWGRVLFPTSNWLRWKGFGMTPETGVALAVGWGMLWATLAYVQEKGEYIRDGRSGNPVRVTMAGDSVPLPHTARLLGSSGTFVFLWWPHTRMAEAVPIESIATLQSLSRHAARQRAARTGKPAAAPAAPVVPSAAP